MSRRARRPAVMGGPFEGVFNTAIVEVLKSLGLTEREAKLAIFRHGGDGEQLVRDLAAASDVERDDWLIQLRGDPILRMTEAEYADYVRGQQGRQSFMTEGEKKKIDELAHMRALDPELAKRVDPFGALTAYGSSMAEDEAAAARSKSFRVPPWLWIAGGGLALWFVVRHSNG